MKKRYSLTYDGEYEMIVEIDDAILTAEVVTEWNEFWGGAKQRADCLTGPLPSLLKMAYMVALRDSITTFDALRGLREGAEEGFPKMDGSTGIAIISFEQFDFDEYEVDCRELA